MLLILLTAMRFCMKKRKLIIIIMIIILKTPSLAVPQAAR